MSRSKKNICQIDAQLKLTVCQSKIIYFFKSLRAVRVSNNKKNYFTSILHEFNQ